MVLFPFHACQQVEINVEKVSEDEAEGPQVQYGPWEQNVIDIYHRASKGDVDA